MKFTLEKQSDWKFKKEIELNSLQDLLDLVKSSRHPIIIYGKTLKIYDDYLDRLLCPY